MTALVMTWADSKHGDLRALVDVEYSDGERHPYGAARAETVPQLNEWAHAIALDAGADKVKFYDCGELAAASFSQVRAVAGFKTPTEASF